MKYSGMRFIVFVQRKQYKHNERFSIVFTLSFGLMNI